MEGMKKLISCTLSAALLAGSLAIPAAASDNGFEDVKGHWAESAITEWSGYQVLGGYGNGSFGPNDSITRAQMAQVLYQTLRLPKAKGNHFTDVPDDAWYAEAVNACAEAGLINGFPDGTFGAHRSASREETMVLMARTLQVAPAENTDVLDEFSDGGQVADWAAETVAALVESGYIQGNDGKLSPQNNITRAATVTILDNAVTTYIHEPGEYNLNNGDTSGIVLVAAEDVTLRGRARGDVLVAQGAAKGSVTLQNVRVDGTLSLVAEDADVRITGESQIGAMSIAQQAENVSVVVEKDAVVSSVESSAPGVQISGQGKVESVQVSGDNTSVTTSGTKVEVSEGTSGTQVDGKPVEGGASVESKPSTGGSTGGTGGSGNSHIHKYVDGICEFDGSVDPSFAQANTAEELQAALDEGKNVVVTGVIGSAEENTQYNVTSSVMIRGAEDSKVYGSFVVEADGVSFVKMHVENPGKDTYGEVFKNAINAHAARLELRDCTFVAGQEFANGVVIFPSAEEVAYTITGNTFEGYNKGDGSWSTTGLMITSQYDLSAKEFFESSEASSDTNMDSTDDLAIIHGNTFNNCSVGYARNAWASSEEVYAALNYKAFSRAAEGAVFYFNDENIDLTSGAGNTKAITIAMLDGTVEIDAHASALPEKVTISLMGGSLTAMGTATDNQEELLTLAGYGEGARLLLSEGVTAEVFFDGTNAKPVMTIHGDVTVPAGQIAYTHFGSDPDIIGAEITVNGNLTVDGTLKITSANGSGTSGSSLTVTGDLVVNEGGTVTKSSKGVLTVEGETRGDGVWPGKGE